MLPRQSESLLSRSLSPFTPLYYGRVEQDNTHSYWKPGGSKAGSTSQRIHGSDVGLQRTVREAPQARKSRRHYCVFFWYILHLFCIDDVQADTGRLEEKPVRRDFFGASLKLYNCHLTTRPIEWM